MRTPREEAHAVTRIVLLCVGDAHSVGCDSLTAAIENARADGIVSMVLCHGSPFDSAHHLGIELRSVVLATDRVRG